MCAKSFNENMTHLVNYFKKLGECVFELYADITVCLPCTSQKTDSNFQEQTNEV